MCTRPILPLLTLVLLVPNGEADGKDVRPTWATSDGAKSASQQFGELLVHQWIPIHTAAVRRGQPVHANLAFDPQSGSIRLERGIDGPTTAERIRLPSGMTWQAFHISVHGIRKLAFPVVLQRPHHYDERSPQDDEEVWIFGKSKNEETHFHVSCRTTGPTGGGGGGWHTELGTVKVGMPPVRDPGFHSRVSMLPAGALRGRPAEFVESNGRRIIEVLREPAE